MKHEERTMCIQFVKQVNSLIKWNQCAPNFKLVHIPNEQTRKTRDDLFNMLAGKKLKEMGRVAGITDYFVLWLDGNIMTFGFLEAKKPGTKTKELKDSQRDWQIWCEKSGVRHDVFRTVEEGISILKEWGALK